ncbi:MAG: BPSS1780 family membrane protein [Pseudomonadota bacterium]
MEIRSVDAGHGWQWLVAGFALFKKNPLIWIVLCTILFLIALVLGMVPLFGQFAFYIFTPIFVAGLMQGCKTLQDGEELEIAHLFAGFHGHATQLVTVGGIYLLGQVLILGVMMLIGGSAILSVFMHGPESVNMEEMMRTSAGLISAGLVGLALSVPLMMAVWFAPALVTFHGMAAGMALRLSFFACWKNMAAFLVYGLIILALGVVAIMPFGLGLLVLIPVCITSLYESYRDIFQLT